MIQAGKFFFSEAMKQLLVDSRGFKLLTAGMLVAAVCFIASCANLDLPETYDRGPCGDNVDTTSIKRVHLYHASYRCGGESGNTATVLDDHRRTELYVRSLYLEQGAGKRGCKRLVHSANNIGHK